MELVFSYIISFTTDTDLLLLVFLAVLALSLFVMTRHEVDTPGSVKTFATGLLSTFLFAVMVWGVLFLIAALLIGIATAIVTLLTILFSKALVVLAALIVVGLVWSIFFATKRKE